jgi:Mg-chelatase subunit ChlD
MAHAFSGAGVMRFSAPLLLPLLLAALWFWRASSSRIDRRRRWLRLAAVVTLVLAASGLEIRSGDSPVSVMFAIDRSGSMAASYQRLVDQVRTMTAGATPQDRAGVVAFASTAAIEQPLRPVSSLAMSSQATASVGLATNVAASLRVARAALPAPAASRIVLFSDGRETAGDMLAEASRAAHSGIPIDVVLPDTQDRLPIDVLRITAPATVRRDESFAITVSAHGLAGTSGVATLTTAGEPPRNADITLSNDGYGSAMFALTASEVGIKTYEATVHTPDRDFADDPRRVGAVVVVSGTAHALYVGTRANEGRSLLRSAGFESRAIDVATFPRAAAALGAYDAVVLDDIRPDSMDAAQVSALKGHIERHGAGLLFLGGRNSLDPALLAGHPLADLLPIDVRPRGGERSPSLALIVAFDKSGSMDDRVDGVPRIEFARLAVRRVLDAVPSSDAVGVIAFDSTAHVVAPLAPGHDPTVLANRLRDVSPAGATAIAPALQLADLWFASASGFARQHVLLVSDGRTSPDDVARVQNLVATRRFELSVVALGADADRQVLRTLAESTGGRAYFPSDVRELPAIVARESARVAGGRIVDASFPLLSQPHPIVTSLGDRILPRIGGYIVAATRPTAESPLQSPLDDPVLATWRYGIGRVAVYTAEWHGAWSAPLRAWNGFPALTRATLQWTARRLQDDLLYARFTEKAGDLILTVEAFEGDEPISALRCHAVVRGPQGENSSLSLAETGLGRYEARIDATEPGVYVATITGEREADRFNARTVRGVFWSDDAEYRWSSPDIDRLTRLAEGSGGRVLRAGENPFALPREPAYTPVRSWLALTALLLFLTELLTPLLPKRQPLTGARGSPPREAAA